MTAMTEWNPSQARAIAAPHEVRVATRRPDGTLRPPTTIWIVRDGERVFIRSTNGRDADWFRAAAATGAGQILAGPETYDVVFTEVTDDRELAAADSGYRDKYRQYATVVAHLEEDGPRSATLQVTPA
jgi:hypothetical protein